MAGRPRNPAVRAAVVSACAALAGLVLLWVAEQAWRPGIERNRHERMVREVSSALAGAEIPPGTEVLEGAPPPGGALESLGRRARLFRAVHAGEVRAVALAFGVRDGYSGPVTLLIGVDSALRIAGVRVLEHSETPGIGDFIGDPAGAWIGRFTGVAASGKEVDAVAGATVTSLALIRAVESALRALEADRALVFRPEGAAGDGKEPR